MNETTSYLNEAGVPAELLTDDELKNKLVFILKQKDVEIQNGKVEIEKIRVNSEQQCFELEKQLQETIQRLNEDQSKLRNDDSKLEDYEKKLSDANETITDLKNKFDDVKSELEVLKIKNNDLSVEKTNLVQGIERLNKKADDLNDEVKSLTRKLSESNRVKCETLLKLEDAIASESISLAKVRHMEQEKERLTKIIDSLNTEMAQATQSVYTARTEQGHKILELQSKLTQAEEQSHLDREAKEMLRSVLEERDKKVESLITQLKDLREANIQAESQFSHELRSQVKLANLYKASVEESQERVKQLLSAAEEMQSLLKQAVDDNKTLHDTYEREKKELEVLLLEREEEINKLKKELVNANELLSQCRKQVVDVDVLSPAAAAASNLLKSGKSLTQIYVEYIELSDQLQEEKEINAKLSLYLEQILKEVEEKAPYLQKQKENLEKSMESVSLLSQELQKLKMERDYFENNNLEMARKTKILFNDLELAEKSKTDLSRQLCYLLKEIEILKGRKVVEDSEEGLNSNGKTIIDNIINENMIDFKDILELQNQNQKLLAVVRELSEKRQGEENEEYEARIKELKEELEFALQQITELRDDRNKQNEVVTSIIRQRDMYKMLATPNGNEDTVMNDDKAETTKKASPLKSPAPKQDAQLSNLQEEFNQHKAETKEKITTLTEHLEKVKEERVQLHLENTKLSSQLEFSDDRYKSLTNTADGYKKEIQALSIRNEKLSGLAAKHEEISSSLRNELVALQQKISQSELEVMSSRREKTLLQQSEAQLRGEIDALKAERSSQSMLMANLQAIQKNLESSDNDWKALLKARLAALEKEVFSLQNKLALEEERSRQAADAWEVVRNELNQAVKEQTNKQFEIKEELIHSYSMVHELRMEKAALEVKLKTFEVPSEGSFASEDVSSKTNIPENNENTILQLQEARSTITSLREQLKRTNDHVIQLKSMSNSLEAELSKHNQISHQFKVEMEQSLSSKVLRIADLEKDLKNTKKENEDLIKEKNDIVMKYLLENTELQANSHKATTELENIKNVNDRLRKSEQDLKQELQTQLELLAEIRRDYEKEMAAHTSDIEHLERLQREHDETCQKLKLAEESAKNADYMLEVTNNTWQDQEAKLKESMKHIHEENKELTSQNRNLLELLDKLRAQVLVQQNRGSTEGTGDFNREHSEDQMFDVIKYLRKEKEIAVANLEVNTAENLRLTTKIEFLEKRLEETTKLLKDFQDKQQVSVTSAVQHAELLRKVELLNVLTDGNRILRSEKNDLLKRIKEFEIKLTENDAELTTIKATNQDLLVQRDTLQVERKALEGDSRRWQLRAQHLVEQTTKANADDIKKSLQEKELLEKQVNVMKEEMARLKSSLSVSENNLTAVQKDLENLKTELASKSQELTQLTSDSVAKDEQVAHLNRDLQQVRKIGRDYKTKFFELKKQNDLLKTENEQLAAGTNASAAENMPQVNVAEAVESAKQEVKLEFESKLKEAEENVKASEEKVKKIRQSAYQRINTLTAAKDEQQREIEEFKLKYNQLEQNKNDESIRTSNMVNELENNITVLKNELVVTRGSLSVAYKDKSSLQKDVEELNSKLSIQQKQLEAIQKQLKDSMKMSSTASLSRDSSILAQSSSDVVNPPTANIKPMATPSSSVVRHPHPSSGPSSRLTPMGRIRPITAVSPASSRTAAVPPTSASSSMAHSQQQDSPDDGHPTPSTGVSSTSNVPQATVAPTQAVPKHSMVTNVQLQISHQSISLSEDIVSATNTGLSATGSFEDRGFEAELGESSSASADNEMPKKNRDVESSSTDGLSSTTDSIKRPRDDSEIDSSSEALVERSPKKRICRIEESRMSDPFPVLSNSSDSVVQHRGAIAQVQATTSQAMIAPSTIGESAVDDVELEIIELESDDDSDDGEMQSRGNDQQDTAANDEDEADDDDEYEIEQEEIEEEEFSEVTGPDMEEEERFRESHYSEDNDVEIIEDSEGATRGNDGEQPSEAIESVAVPSQHRVIAGRYLNRFPTRSGRLPSIGRQQTVPCSSIGPPSGCEDGDSIVPSTPTLFDSRRNDGFAEAISSPQVPPETFLFGNSEQPSQLASQALAMDDTRMDLTFDDGTGRSVPSTPHQVSPLDATITELASDMLPDTSNASLSSHQQSFHSLKASTTEADQAAPVPKITITGLDERTFTVEDVEREGENSGSGTISVTEEQAVAASKEDGSNNDDTTVTIVDVVALESREDATLSESEVDVGTDAPVVTAASESEGASTGASQSNEGNLQVQEQQQQRKTTPIVWDEPVQSRRGNLRARGSPGRNFARRSRPSQVSSGPSRGGYTYYREVVEQQPNRLGPQRGARMGMPPGRGGRPFPRQRR